MDLPICFSFFLRAISKDNEKCFNRHTGRPFTSKRFKAFEEELRYLLKRQLPEGFTPFMEEGLVVELTTTFCDRRRPDVGNVPKSILDAFNKLLWKDDKLITTLITSIEYGKEDKIELNILGCDPVSRA